MTDLLPLGDQAALAYFPDEAAAFRFTAAVRRANDAWLVDVVQAYTSVAVFYDLGRTAFATVAGRLKEVDASAAFDQVAPKVRSHRIACCYEMQLDLALVAEQTGLSADEVIRQHV